MAAGTDAGGAHVGDELALEHMLTGANQQAAAVGVQGHHAVAVVNADPVAVAAIPSGLVRLWTTLFLQPETAILIFPYSITCRMVI